MNEFYIQKSMEPIAAKRIERESHIIQLEVYHDFAIATASMPMRMYSDLLMHLGHGSWEAERYALNRFLREIFSKPNSSAHFFDNAMKFHESLVDLGIQVEQDDNDWFKTVLFRIDERKFSKDLEGIISYIKSSSEAFEADSTQGKIKIANNLLKNL